MKFTLRDLNWAVEENIISSETRTTLASALEKRYAHKPSLTFANVLYYLGGLIVISAMTLYTTMAWEDLGGVGHLAVAMIYAGVFTTLGNWLWRFKGQLIPGGILITAAVCMTPMAIFGIQETTGWWVMGDPGVYRDFYQWIRSGWAIMEVATVITGLIALRFFKFPFITLPIAFSLWFMSMDLVAMLYGPGFSWDERKLVSLWFGLGMLITAFLVDRRTREDYAFWGYLFGMMAFWGGLTSLDSDSEIGKFAYCMINVALMAVSVLLARKVFIVFGSIGVAIYLGHLASDVFKDELLFTFALSGFGLAVIAFGVFYHKHEERITERLIAMLPGVVKRSLPQYRG